MKRKNPTIPLPPDFFPKFGENRRQQKIIRDEIYDKTGIWWDDMDAMMEELHQLHAQHIRRQFKVIMRNPRRGKGQAMGFMVRGEWANMLLSGEKTVETRSYPIPPELIGQPLLLIKTGTPTGAMAIGMIQFKGSIRYRSKAAWASDRKRHRVPANSKVYGWKTDKEKHGWVVQSVHPLPAPVPAPDSPSTRTNKPRVLRWVRV